MAYQKININAPFFSDIEPESRGSGVSESRRDVLTDQAGTTIRRPGLSVFASGLSYPVSGMYYWEAKDLVFLTSGTSLYSLTKTGTLKLISASWCDESEHTIWAEASDLTLVTTGADRKIFAATGGRISVYDGTTAQRLTGTDTPDKSSHIIMFDSYLLSNELSDPKWDETIKYSKVADPITFEGAFFSAESKGDVINAIHSGWDEIALFGTRSIENYYNNRVDPFVPIPGGTIQSGTLTPWSIKLADNSYIYLDSDKKVIQLTGRQPVRVSQSIDNLLDGQLDVVGTRADLLDIGNNKLYLLTVNNRTFVFDYGKNEWAGEWGHWNTVTAKYDPFRARNFLNVKQWGINLCSDIESGTIYKIDFDTYQDNGNEIRSSIITGNIDHGTGREKRSNELKLKIKRGVVSQTTMGQIAPKLLVRWADDGYDVWSNWREVDLGFAGNKNFFYSLYMLGSYRARKYEFMCSDNTPFSIVSAEEDITLLR